MVNMPAETQLIRRRDTLVDFQSQQPVTETSGHHSLGTASQIELLLYRASPRHAAGHQMREHCTFVLGVVNSERQQAPAGLLT